MEFVRMEIIAPEHFNLIFQESVQRPQAIFLIGASGPTQYTYANRRDYSFVLSSYDGSIKINIMCTGNSNKPSQENCLWYGNIQSIFNVRPSEDLFMVSGTENLINECNKIENNFIRKTLTNFVLSNLDFFSTL
jgi:hypothetical protein